MDRLKEDMKMVRIRQKPKALNFLHGLAPYDKKQEKQKKKFKKKLEKKLRKEHGK